MASKLAHGPHGAGTVTWVFCSACSATRLYCAGAFNRLTPGVLRMLCSSLAALINRSIASVCMHSTLQRTSTIFSRQP